MEEAQNSYFFGIHLPPPLWIYMDQNKRQFGEQIINLISLELTTKIPDAISSVVTNCYKPFVHCYAGYNNVHYQTNKVKRSISR